ncbi:MAG: homoserine dehydrogenase [Candidatus Thermofonsia Clade 1 bacterium]|uniref:Homoserine dehydrogenase n=1 Tax=Candidatus Thermofonsia Clade 1 bacterium TaxID=2364210 RepID=A0A2M8PFC5_9CHLR|nr:MAG: homoserine dehydrogenase [Candidatus Thermofonsia Clade 1 bacterium]
MRTLGIALIGLGAVGRAFIALLQARRAYLAAQYNLDVKLVGVATARRGTLFCPEGLDLAALSAVASAELSAYPDQARLLRTLEPLSLLTRPSVDVVIELTPTVYARDAEPAMSHIRAALAAGKHVITANKGPIALAYPELRAQAAHRGVFLGFEGTVMGGTPALRMARQGLAGCQISAVRGILNGTTNFILSEMESGKSYAEALSEAQARGYAEADPSNDVEGIDAAGKLIILAHVIFGKALRLDEIGREGITRLSQADIQAAQASGERWKLIAQAAIQPDGQVSASVKPMRLPLSDPLAQVGGGMNAITYQTDLIGAVTLIGAGAGGTATAYALLSDLIELAEQL